MLLWIGFAVLTAIAVAGLLRPLVKGAEVRGHARREADLNVYRTQLGELDADVARGVLGREEAEAARIEISRKILQIDSGDAYEEVAQVEPTVATQAKPSAATPAIASLFSMAVTALVPIAAVAIYMAVGAPHLPDAPHAARMKEDLKDASVAALLARVEARLRDNPEDGRGWDVLAPVYFRAGRFNDAADAYRSAARLLGATPERTIGYIKSAILANNGVITDELKQLAQELTETVPDRPEPKFWIGLSLEQDGNFEGARAAYERLLETATDESPWRGMVQRRLDGLIDDTATKKP